jgi:hypothetical protein
MGYRKAAAETQLRLKREVEAEVGEGGTPEEDWVYAVGDGPIIIVDQLADEMR